MPSYNGALQLLWGADRGRGDGRLSESYDDDDHHSGMAAVLAGGSSVLLRSSSPWRTLDPHIWQPSSSATVAAARLPRAPTQQLLQCRSVPSMARSVLVLRCEERSSACAAGRRQAGKLQLAVWARAGQSRDEVQMQQIHVV